MISETLEKKNTRDNSPCEQRFQLHNFAIKKNIKSHKIWYESELEDERICSYFMKTIKSNRFTFWRNEETTENTMKKLSKALRSSKYLKELKILNKSYSGEEIKCKFLSQGLESLKTLKNLKIDFQWNDEITNTKLSHFGKTLKRLFSLKTVYLNFGNCQKLTEEALRHISDGLKRIFDLESFILHFNSNDGLTDAGLCYLSDGLEKLDSIQNIYLDFAQ